jgi:hypothetical protein
VGVIYSPPWETKLPVPLFVGDELLISWCLNLNPGYFGCFTFILVLFWESCLLVPWCAGGRCGIMDRDEDRDRSRRPGVEDRGWSHRSGTRWSDDREVGWHRVRSAPCIWRRGVHVSCLSLKTNFDGLSVVWPQNHWDGFLWFGIKTGDDDFSQFDLKTGGGFLGWASKPRLLRVSRFVPQNR